MSLSLYTTLYNHIHTPSLIHICIVLTSYYISILLPSSVTLDLSVGFFNNGNECITHASSITHECQNALSKATLITGITVSIQQLLAFATAPIVGIYSDIYGRVVPIFLSVCIVFFTLLSLVLYQIDFITLYIYFIMKALCGLTECMSVGLAYVSDITNNQQRLYSFGTLTACLSISLITAPLLGTLFYDRSTLFSFASICSLFTLLYVSCILPESIKHSSQNKQDNNNKDIYYYGNPLNGLKILHRTTMFRRLALCMFFSNAVLEGIFSILVLYFKHQFVVNETMQASILSIWYVTYIYLL